MQDAQTFPFDMSYPGGGDRQVLEALSEPLYFNATYPSDGTKDLAFFCGEGPTDTPDFGGRNLAISNVPCKPYRSPEGEDFGGSYFHLPFPQQFQAIGIALRPVSPQLGLDRIASYMRLRDNATFDFMLGQKSYTRGPLDQVLDCSADPRAPVSIGDRFWPVSITMRKPLRVVVATCGTCGARPVERHAEDCPHAGGRNVAVPLYIPSGQSFGLFIKQREPIRVPYDLPLRAYIVGCWQREVA